MAAHESVRWYSNPGELAHSRKVADAARLAGAHLRFVPERDIMAEMTALERSIHDVLARLGSPGVVSAYLFGSRARGSAHRESDVDVGVVLDRGAHATRSGRFDERVRLASELIGALHVNAVDLVVLNDVPPLLARRVLLEGRQVYCADVDADRDFRRDTLLRAADLEPFLARMRALKLDALAR